MVQQHTNVNVEVCCRHWMCCTTWLMLPTETPSAIVCFVTWHKMKTAATEQMS